MNKAFQQQSRDGPIHRAPKFLTEQRCHSNNRLTRAANDTETYGGRDVSLDDSSSPKKNRDFSMHRSIIALAALLMLGAGPALADDLSDAKQAISDAGISDQA